MYEKFRNLSNGEPECAEDLADVLYELGKGLYDRKHFELAATWLERALDAIDDQELDRMSEHAGDLRLAIMQKFGSIIPLAYSQVDTNKAQSRLCL